VLYHLSHTSSSFYFIYLFIYFEMGVSWTIYLSGLNL
jgi:hypothetical protein